MTSDEGKHSAVQQLRTAAPCLGVANHPLPPDLFAKIAAGGTLDAKKVGYGSLTDGVSIAVALGGVASAHSDIYPICDTCRSAYLAASSVAPASAVEFTAVVLMPESGGIGSAAKGSATWVDGGGGGNAEDTFALQIRGGMILPLCNCATAQAAHHRSDVHAAVSGYFVALVFPTSLAVEDVLTEAKQQKGLKTAVCIVGPSLLGGHFTLNWPALMSI